VPEDQAETSVLSKLVPSLNISIAANCWVPPTGIEAVAGITTNETNVAVFTVNVADAVLPPKAAVMTVVPGATPVAKPLVGAVEETPATPGVPEDQVEDAVTSTVAPSPYVAVAVNCWVPLTGIEAVLGVTAREISGSFQWPPPISPFELLHPCRIITTLSINKHTHRK
jgi:hypothetical protein